MKIHQYCFIGGAPKCGTSAVFDFLKEHSNANVASKKETFYFMEKANPLIFNERNYHTHALDGFETYFEDEHDGIRLEATTHLIYQLEMVDVISSMNGKMAVILREPAERIYSSFSYTKNNLGRIKSGVSFKDFIRGLLSNDQTALKSMMLEEKSSYVLSRELQYSKYVDYIKPWSNKLGLKLKVFFYEDLVSDSPTFMQDIADFFELSLRKDSHISKKNITYGNRFGRLHIMLSYLRDKNLLKYRALQPVKNLYKKLQKTPIKVEKDIETMKVLKEYFRPYDTKLRAELNLNKLPWE